MDKIDRTHDKTHRQVTRPGAKTRKRPTVDRISSGYGAWRNSPKDPVGRGDSPEGIVFLLDVDNTLLDNDHIETDLKQYLAQKFSTASRDRYWDLLEELRAELGYADYL